MSTHGTTDSETLMVQHSERSNYVITLDGKKLQLFKPCFFVKLERYEVTSLALESLPSVSKLTSYYNYILLVQNCTRQ